MQCFILNTAAVTDALHEIEIIRKQLDEFF
jgi:hypothetical protein